MKRASEQRRRFWCSAGLFLTLLGIYLLSCPGRIDIIDGYWRYEVTKNWLDTGQPLVEDPQLLAAPGGIVNRATGKSYSAYNAAPSVTPMPFVAISRLLPGHSLGRDYFAFSLAGPVFGAILGAMLCLTYGLLGVALRESLLYTAIFCLATLWWPGSVTAFDQNQHATLLLGATLLAWLSGRRQSLGIASLAGLLAGLLINYQEMYLLLLPAVGLAVFAAPEEGLSGEVRPTTPDRAALARYVTFGLCCCAGLALYCAYNEIRFGTPLMLAKYTVHPKLQAPIWGNPLAGFLGLAISPGKGIFWFSPPLILAVLGARSLYRRAPVLAMTIAVVSIIHLLVIVHLAFFGGDWCWGPRYVIPLIPLWALAFPYAAVRLRCPRRLIVPLAAAGVLIQVMGVSIDSHRFFYELHLPPYTWETDRWFYFKHSQLAARPVEVVAQLRDGPPGDSARFDDSSTGHLIERLSRIHAPARSPRWMGNCQLYYLLRPWWGWARWAPPYEQPADPLGLLLVCGGLAAVGGLMLAKSLRIEPPGIVRQHRSPGSSVLAARGSASPARGED